MFLPEAAHAEKTHVFFSFVIHFGKWTSITVIEYLNAGQKSWLKLSDVVSHENGQTLSHRDGEKVCKPLVAANFGGRVDHISEISIEEKHF